MYIFGPHIFITVDSTDKTEWLVRLMYTVVTVYDRQNRIDSSCLSPSQRTVGGLHSVRSDLGPQLPETPRRKFSYNSASSLLPICELDVLVTRQWVHFYWLQSTILSFEKQISKKGPVHMHLGLMRPKLLRATPLVALFLHDDDLIVLCGPQSVLFNNSTKKPLGWLISKCIQLLTPPPEREGRNDTCTRTHIKQKPHSMISRRYVFVTVRTAEEAPTIFPHRASSWAQWMWHQKFAVSVWCWFQDRADFGTLSQRPRRLHSHCLPCRYFSISDFLGGPTKFKINRTVLILETLESRIVENFLRPEA